MDIDTFGFGVNKLILGDNLEILRTMGSETVDLMYLDPPFFSNRNYEVIWGDEGEIRSFQDRWAGGIDHYIGWLYDRVEQMHRILKPEGSIYLHCDWHADAYIRVYILDKIFGINNFVNEIIWCYETGGRSNSFYPRKHDNIFLYVKDHKGRIWNDEQVRIDRDTKTMHEPVLLDEEGKKYQRNIKNGKEYRYYLDKGVLPNDYWTDIQALNPSAKERIGYPTQKPEALLERIIKASSNKGDVVMDPFMGGGTTIAVADRLNRQWIGIDQSPMAVKVTEFRLERQYGAAEDQKALFAAPYVLQLHKYDEETLFNEDPFAFETWIIQQFGAVPQNKKGGDKGVDGKTMDGVPIQVKQSKAVGVGVIKNFSVSAKQFNKMLFEKNVSEKKPVGYVIAFSFGKGAIEEAARLKNAENVMIKLVRVDEIVPLSVKPSVAVHIKELEKAENGARNIECTVVGKSLSGIEFYSWDFQYDGEKAKFRPSVIMDREGKQIVALQPGTHTIAVKAVDNDGLENTEVVKLKINGGLTQSPAGAFLGRDVG
jgi:DNA modification methylase